MTFIRCFFDHCIMLHEFFQRGKVAALYEGKTIGRLLNSLQKSYMKTIL